MMNWWNIKENFKKIATVQKIKDLSKEGTQDIIELKKDSSIGVIIIPMHHSRH